MSGQKPCEMCSGEGILPVTQLVTVHDGGNTLTGAHVVYYPCARCVGWGSV